MKGKTITGTEGGLANMKRLSEEAQKLLRCEGLIPFYDALDWD